jgi:hypothetical protein
MNSIDRKILRCQREIEASRPKGMSFEEFEKGAFPYPPVLYGGITTYRFDKLEETTPPIEERSRPADAPKFKVGDRVRPAYNSNWGTGLVTKTQYDAHRRCQVTYYVPENSRRETFDEDADLELIPSQPKADEEGWIEWKGGACPLELGARVEVRFNNSDQRSDRPAGEWGWASGPEAWRICAYRVIA